jgi:hypothetical protein
VGTYVQKSPAMGVRQKFLIHNFPYIYAQNLLIVWQKTTSLSHKKSFKYQNSYPPKSQYATCQRTRTLHKVLENRKKASCLIEKTKKILPAIAGRIFLFTVLDLFQLFVLAEVLVSAVVC